MMTGRLAAAALMVGLAVGGASCRGRLEPKADPFNREPLNERCAKVIPVAEGSQFIVEKSVRELRETFATGIVRGVRRDGVVMEMSLPDSMGTMTVLLRYGDDIKTTGQRDLSGNTVGTLAACSGVEGGEAKLGGDVVGLE